MALQQVEKEQAQAKTKAISSCRKKQLTIAQVVGEWNLTTPEPEFKCTSITWCTKYQYWYWPNTHIPISESGVSVKLGIRGTLIYIPSTLITWSSGLTSNKRI